MYVKNIIIFTSVNLLWSTCFFWEYSFILAIKYLCFHCTKDVLHRTKNEEDPDSKLVMKMDDLKNIQNAQLQEKSSLEQFIIAEVIQTESDHKKVNEKVDQVLEVVKQYGKDYEQDFKPWTDRSVTPDTNETLENFIKNMHENVQQINLNLENNSKLRQSTIAITEVLKNL